MKKEILIQEAIDGLTVTQVADLVKQLDADPDKCEIYATEDRSAVIEFTRLETDEEFNKRQAGKKKIVVLSGAGISAESGIKTFRDCEDGLWNNYKIEDVCTPEAWEKNPTLVNDFYNMRRIEAMNAQPNAAHIALGEAEDEFDIHIITQNVDDLHERGGSVKVMHLHGELVKARSSNKELVSLNESEYETYPVDREGIQPYQVAPDGFLLRPHIVWFEEAVPNIIDAEKLVQECDVLIIVGTSLNVYPAAGLAWHAGTAPIWLVDPNVDADTQMSFPARVIRAKATVGIPAALRQIRAYFSEKETNGKV
jgi:NAD-dependent deacetylase